jgi:hypothetical protein
MTNLAIALVLALNVAIPGTSQDRLKVVSEDMVSVVNEEFESGMLKSGIQEPDALAMLAAVAVGESNLRNDIETCKVAGDGGKSVGLGQVMRGPNWKGYTRQQICNNRKIQLRLSLQVIDLCWARASQADAVFRCYTSGNPYKDTFSSRHEFAIYKNIKGDLGRIVNSQRLQTCHFEAKNTCSSHQKMTCEL